MTKTKLTGLAGAAATSVAALLAANGPASAMDCTPFSFAAPAWETPSGSYDFPVYPPDMGTCEDDYQIPFAPDPDLGIDLKIDFPSKGMDFKGFGASQRYGSYAYAYAYDAQPYGGDGAAPNFRVRPDTRVIGQGIDGDGSPISRYGLENPTWRRDFDKRIVDTTPLAHMTEQPNWFEAPHAAYVEPSAADYHWSDETWFEDLMKFTVGEGPEVAAISSNSEFFDVEEYKETPWIAENFDPDGIVERKKKEHFESRARELGLGFRAAGEASFGVVGMEFGRFLAALSKNPDELLENAFDVEETLRPTLDQLKQTSQEISKEQKEGREAAKQADYYSAEIGSDERPTNLSYEQAEEGLRFERRMENGSFTDGHGTTHETEVYQLPAENTPVSDPGELSA